MKKSIVLIGLLLLIFTAGCSASDPAADKEKGSPGFHQISQEEAKEMMAKDDGHVVVDVRRQDEYDAGHIPGAILIPNESIGCDSPEALPDYNQIILIYCRTGNRSKQAAQKLASMGYTNIYEFGGITTWTGNVVTELNGEGGTAMKDTALLVIDMQNGFLNERSPRYIDGAAATVPACAEMIAFCRAQNVPVFFVTRVYAADGSDVEHTRYEAWAKGGKPLSPGCAKEISADMPEAFGEDSRDYHIIKPRYSAFFATGLDLILRRLGIRHLFLAGTTTPNCIRTSCYDAISLDYAVTVLSDCTSSKTPEIQESNLRDMANVGAVIVSSKEIIEGSERA